MQAIQTKYNGYKFRSRLEARWAVFFDAAGIEYQYEPEGFKLDDGTMYLPDFYLPNVRTRSYEKEYDEGIWVEVKGKMNPEDLRKIDLFSKTNKILVIGDVPKSYDDIEIDYNMIYWSWNFIDGDSYWAYFSKDLNGNVWLAGPEWDEYYDGFERLNSAYTKARQARFEHGEVPDDD